MNRRAKVYYDERICGYLEETETGYKELMKQGCERLGL